MTVLLAYADQISVAPGDRIGFKVSCEGADSYEARIVQLHCCDAGPGGPPFREREVGTPADGIYPGRPQPLRAGSWALVDGFDGIAWEQGFTLQALVFATAPGGREQALLGFRREDSGEGFELALDAAGAPVLSIAAAGRHETIGTGTPLAERRWYRITATLDNGARLARIDARPVHAQPSHPVPEGSAEAPIALSPAAGDGMLAIAARRCGGGPRPRTMAHFDGRIERPRVANRAVRERDWAALGGHQPPPSLLPHLAGAWDLSRDIGGTTVVDVSGHGRHGRTVNLPTRAVTGADWDGSELDWRQAPRHYAAIHFHADDLYDAGWGTDFTFDVPEHLASGVYAARLRAGEAEFHVPFFVRARPGKPSSPVVFLASTATYMAYGNHRSRLLGALTELVQGRLTVLDATDLLLLSHPGLGRSLYDLHDDGSGVAFSSRLRPFTNFRPRGRIWNFAADLLVVDWLERAGLGYDVVTDEDLHEGGADALAPYRVVVTGTHPEYCSAPMLDALESFVGTGGRLMYLGGNGFYWRIAYHPGLPGVIEVRRGGDGVRAWESEPGEGQHAFDGAPGGLWRRLGRPPNRLAGVGFIAEGFDASSHYRCTPASRDPRVAFMFEGISADVIGDYGVLRGGAAGIELDAADPRLGTPPHALVLASSEDHSNVFELVGEEVLVPNAATGGRFSDRVRADLVFFETTGGGAVFSTGSIAWAGSLGHADYDNDIARLSTNVLRRFADPAPFEPPPSPVRGRAP